MPVLFQYREVSHITLVKIIIFTKTNPLNRKNHTLKLEHFYTVTTHYGLHPKVNFR